MNLLYTWRQGLYYRPILQGQALQLHMTVEDQKCLLEFMPGGHGIVPSRPDQDLHEGWPTLTTLTVPKFVAIAQIALKIRWRATSYSKGLDRRAYLLPVVKAGLSGF